MKIPETIEEMPNSQLDARLRSFYASARKQNGDEYTRSSFLSFRNSIERYLNNPPISRGITISKSSEFHSSNKMLEAKIKQLKKSGKGTVVHKDVIESPDLIKLRTSGAFSLDNPWSLLRNVWFHISIHWCRRGFEGQAELKQTSFIIRDDGSGTRRYAIMTHEEISKNHQGGINENPSYERETRMYETDSEVDGVKSLELYLSKLNPSCDAFFQYPKRSQFHKEDPVWYERRSMGKNKLQTMMATISELAHLSKRYTNHCVRATAITLWSDSNIPGRHIISISGHANEKSLEHYNRRPSSSQLRVCSDILAEAIEPQEQATTANSVARASNSVPVLPALSTLSALSMHQSSADNRSLTFPAGLFQNCSVNNVHVHFQNQS